MEVKVKINSKQIFEDGRIEEENNNTTGNIEYLNNGIILEFIEKYDKEELKFKVNILKDKIVIRRNEQNMILDLNNKTKALLETPYGVINLLVTTKGIEIIKDKENLKKLHLKYQIELEDGMKYDNVVDILIS